MPFEINMLMMIRYVHHLSTEMESLQKCLEANVETLTKLFLQSNYRMSSIIVKNIRFCTSCGQNMTTQYD